MSLIKQTDWVPPIHIKQDPRQLTFPIPCCLLPSTRCTLYKRYHQHLNATSTFQVTWVDEANHPVHAIQVPDCYNNIDNIPDHLPPELFQTKIQVNRGPIKVVTITLYYKQSGEGKVLVQGNYCPDWRNNEFEALVGCIRSLYQFLDKPEKLRTEKEKIAHLPLPPEPAGDSHTTQPRRSTRRSARLHPTLETISEGECGVLEAPQPPQALSGGEAAISTLPSVQQSSEILHEADGMAAVSSVPGEDTSLPISTLSMAPPLISLPQQTVSSPATPSLTATASVISCTNTLTSPVIPTNTVTIHLASSSSTATSTLITASQMVPSQSSLLLPPTHHTLVNTTTSSNISAQNPEPHTANPSPTITPTSSPSISNCPEEDDWFDVDGHPTVAKLGCRRRQSACYGHRPPTARPLTLSKTKHALRHLHRQIVFLASRGARAYNSLQAEGVTIKKQIENGLKLHMQRKYERHDEAVNHLAAKIKDLEKQNQTLRSQVGDLRKELRDITASCNNTHHKGTQCKITTKSTSVDALSCANPIAAKGTQEPSNPPASKRVLSTEEVCPQDLSSGKQPTNNAPSSRSNSSSTASSHSTPCQQLAVVRVGPETTHVLLGDSVTKFLEPALVFPNSCTSQNISVPGLTLDDVVHWLRNIPVCRGVQLLVLHVGINTCWHDVITTSRWTEVLKLVKKVFPKAQLHFSSIVPPRSPIGSLAKTVSASNINLATMCQKEGVIFINNRDTFSTSRGLPKKAMYYDGIHPSRQGCSRLTDNIMCAVLSSADPRTQRRVQRAPLLPTPTARNLPRATPHQSSVPLNSYPRARARFTGNTDGEGSNSRPYGWPPSYTPFPGQELSKGQCVHQPNNPWPSCATNNPPTDQHHRRGVSGSEHDHLQTDTWPSPIVSGPPPPPLIDNTGHRGQHSFGAFPSAAQSHGGNFVGLHGGPPVSASSGPALVSLLQSLLQSFWAC